MTAVIGEALPLAVGIAISPIPIIAAILMLLSPRARSTGVGFLLGWVLGIVAVVTLFTTLSSSMTRDADGPRPAAGAIQLVLGSLLLALAVRGWLRRPRDGDPQAMPRWMTGLDRISMPAALGLGLLLSALNPKNLLLGAAAGMAIGTGLTVTSPAGAAPVAIAVYAAVAASTVAVPVLGYLVAATRLRGPLDRLRAWLGANNALIMAVLLLVIGVSLMGKGLGQL